MKLRFMLFFVFISISVFAYEDKLPLEFFNIMHQKRIPHNVIVVEKQTQTAKIYEAEDDKFKFKLINAFNISTGKRNGNKYKQGDLKTPEGVYFINKYIPGESLPEEYGEGAFTLNYPNDLDKLFGKNGTGIWLHGTDVEPLVPYDTRGCVAFPNDGIKYLQKVISPKRTCVIINEKFDYVSYDELKKMDSFFRKFLISWVDAWSNKDYKKYMKYYHSDFYSKNQKMNLRMWKKKKKEVFQEDKNISIDISNLEYYLSGNMMMMNFNQRYSNGGYHDFGKKTVVLTKQDDKWLILREEWNPDWEPNILTKQKNRKQNYRNTASIDCY